MARLFLSLYLGIITSGCVFLLLTAAVLNEQILEYENRSDSQSLRSYLYLLEQLSHTQSLQQMEQHVQRGSALNALNSVRIGQPQQQLSPSHWQQLQTDGILVRGDEDDGTEEIWLKLENGVTWRLTQQEETTSDEDWIDNLLFTALLLGPALAALFWVYSLQRKLSTLENTALAIADGQLGQRVPEGFRHRVGSLNQSFNRMATTIEQLLASHKRLTNAVAHELRSPLFRLRFQMDLLADPDCDPIQRETTLAGASEDLDELETLIEEMLQYARMESARLEPKLKSLRLEPWLQELTERYNYQQRHPVRFTASSEQTTITGDTELLERAIGNLVRNADKYAATEIVLKLVVTPSHWLLTIRDDGPGIAEHDRERIFKPFERLDETRGRETGGHGLGLAIAREIATLHNGTLRCTESPSGHGACFELSLPTNAGAH